MENILELNQIKRIYSIFFVVLWFLCLFLFGIDSQSTLLIYLEVFLLCSSSFLLVLRTFIRKNVFFFISFSYMFMYTIPAWYRGIGNYQISIHENLLSFYEYKQTVLLLALFFIIININIKIKKNIVNPVFKKGNLIFTFLAVIIILIQIFDVGAGVTILKSGGYGEIESGVVSQISEYSLIFFLLLYIYSGGEKKRLLVFHLLIIISIIKPFLFGGRIVSFMLIMLYFILHFKDKFPFKLNVSLLFLGYFVMNLFGNIRSSIFNLKYYTLNDYLAMCLPGNTIKTLGFLNSQEGDVFWASERIIILINEGVINSEYRLMSFLRYLATFVFVPLNDYNLSDAFRDNYSTGGGGLAPIFFFAFLSYFGVVLLGYIVSFVFNKLMTNGISTSAYIYAIMFVVSVPRWFAYYPTSIIKLSLLAILIFKVVDKINMILNGSR